MACILYIQTPAGTMYAYRFSNRKAAERFYEIYQLSSECNSHYIPRPVYVETGKKSRKHIEK